ncbi:MAG: hypothetical protein WC476_07535 [Phycisphaerae bacterium]|jgi:hypothetical protein
MKNFLKVFADRFNDSSVNELRNWDNDPVFSNFLSILNSVSDEQSFLNHYAEAMVAGYFKKLGCTLEVEVPNINNRKADIKVTKDNYSFFVHLKMLNLDKASQKDSKITKRLQELRQIRKPVTFCALFHRSLSDKEMQELYKEAKHFIESSAVGSKMSFKNKCQIELLPGPIGKNVQLVLSMSVKCVDDRKRLYKRLSEAHKQFMSDAINIVLVTSNWKTDFEDFETALLGTTYEDYTVIPPKKGRENDGFWSSDKHHNSYIVGWFNFVRRIDSLNFRMFYRDNYQTPLFVKNLFKKTESVP